MSKNKEVVQEALDIAHADQKMYYAGSKQAEKVAKARTALSNLCDKEELIEKLEGMLKDEPTGEEFERPESWADDVYSFENGEVVGSVWGTNNAINQIIKELKS